MYYLLGPTGFLFIEAPWMEKNTAMLVPDRRKGETMEEWAKRCVRITNIGEPQRRTASETGEKK